MRLIRMSAENVLNPSEFKKENSAEESSPVFYVLSLQGVAIRS